jgi:PIN like domain
MRALVKVTTLRDLFPGYFTPTVEEFDELWKNATFAFDANVLLDLYRLPEENRQVFFSALEKLTDRIFLPHHAAREYLNRRLSVISVRAESYERLKTDSEKLAKDFEALVHANSLGKGKEILEAVRQAAQKIASHVDAAVEAEPDLLHSDDLQTELVGLFDGKVGPRYDSIRLDEIYKQSAQRFARQVPPGYKDIKKPEPERYGDVVIWFQLIDHAKSTKKPLIFITRDSKEDWWLEHNHDIIGPRPELGEEMMLGAGVRFYMYTTPRFLKFAQQFLGLNPEDSKKAASEFERIEKQQRKAEMQAEFAPFLTSDWIQNQSTGWTPTAFSSPVQWDWPTLNTVAFTDPMWNQPMFASATPPKVEAVKTEYLQLLPINGCVFNSLTGKWKVEITRVEESPTGDRACYFVKFDRGVAGWGTRELRLHVAPGALRTDEDWRYKSAIRDAILEWLGSGQSNGEITLAPR